MKNTVDFYRHVEEEGWEETKADIRSKAAAKVEAKLVDTTARKWSEYRQLIQASKAQVAAILQRTVQDGRIVRPLTSIEIAQLVGAMDKMLKAESFMDGGPTERIESRNLNLDMVDLIERIERGEL